MRHRVAGRKLSRSSEHRMAMRRNMVASLFEHETISTTIQKAKEVKPFAEKLITLGKKGDLASRRRAISLLGRDRKIVENEEGSAVKKGTVVGKLFSEIGPRYLDRSGGYTRIVKLPMKRLGDNGQLVLLQLLGEDEKVEPKPKKEAKAKKPAAKKTKQVEPEEQAVAAEAQTSAEEPAEVEAQAQQAQESQDQPQQEDSEQQEDGEKANE